MSARRFGLVLAVVMMPALAVSVYAEDEILAQYGDITVTQEDMQRYVDFYLPPEDQAKALEGNFHQYVGNILMMRELARRAQKEEVGADAEQLAWQQEYQAVVWRVKAYQEHAIAEAQKNVDWEARARELYIAEPERFISPDKVDAAHILVQPKGRTDEEALKLIADVREKALAGESFAKLAEQFSEDKGSSAKGGNLGEFEASQMVPEFADAAFALNEPGAISDVVKTQFGYHVILLNKKVPGAKRPFEEIKPKLIEELQRNLAKRTVDNMLADLRTEAYSQQLNIEAANEFRAKYGLKPLPALDSAADQ